MSLPVADDIRNYLEGYCISADVLSDSWINSRINNFVLPQVEEWCRDSFSGEKEITEMYSGHGEDILILNRKSITSIIKVEILTIADYAWELGLTNFRLVPGEGIIKSLGTLQTYPFTAAFPKGTDNIRITYRYGQDMPDDIKEAVIMLTSSMCLNLIGARTGGGSLSVQGYSRNYGAKGMYTDIIVQLNAQAYAILNKYMTSVVGA